MSDLKRPFAVETLPWEPWSHGERFGGRVRHLGRHAGGTRVGVNLEELPPGKQSCPLHYHMLVEEHLYILEGRPTLRLGDERIALAPGDYVCFPEGPRRSRGRRATRVPARPTATDNVESRIAAAVRGGSEE